MAPIGRVNAPRKSSFLLSIAATALALHCAAPAPSPESPNAIVLETGESDAAPRASEPLPDARLKPCSEDNPDGCTKGPTLSKLDVGKRYSVTINPDDPTLGSSDAPVTLVVFSDFQCPFCGQLEAVLSRLRTRFGAKLRFVWKDLPLPTHTFALSAAVLAREAYVKFGAERFWAVHDELFVHQSLLSDGWLSEFAKNQNLTWPPDARYVPRINQDVELADQLAINATPTVFVNGRPVIGAQDDGVYADLIVDELDHAK